MVVRGIVLLLMSSLDLAQSRLGSVDIQLEHMAWNAWTIHILYMDWFPQTLASSILPPHNQAPVGERFTSRKDSSQENTHFVFILSAANIKINIQLTTNWIILKKIQMPQCFHDKGCHIVCTLIPNGICVHMTIMHMLTYCTIREYVSMVDHSEVVDSHGTLLCAAGLLWAEYG